MAKQYQRTPKVFNAKFTPPKPKKTIDWSQYRAVGPVLVVVAIVAAIWLIGRLPFFAISTIEITGTEDQAIVSRLDDLKGKSIFTSQLKRVRTDILKDNSSIEDIDCRRGIPNLLRCKVSTRQPVFVWRTSGQDYLADANSMLYAKKTADDGMVIVEDKSNMPVDLGSQVLNAELVEIYLDVYRQFTDQGYAVGELFIRDSVYQLSVWLLGCTNAEINYPAGKSLEVKMAINSPIDIQILAVGEIIKTKGAALTTYIDLRVPGYAYTK